ncbi:TPR-like protein [Aureobasidium pullulans]|nr:TPR-like protein [Aureobasidium pullulans]
MLSAAAAISITSSALSISKTAAEIAITLYIFFQDAKKLPKTAEAFAEEVKALGMSCEIVGIRLEGIVQDHETSLQSGLSHPGISPIQLWGCLETQMSACQNTINELEEAVSATKGVDKDTRYHSKVFRNLKLKLRNGDIAEARERIRSHTIVMQTVLQCINMLKTRNGSEVSYLAPQRADQHLQTQIAELVENTQELTDLFNKGIAATSNAALIRVSNQVISSGQTLYSGSIAGGSVLGEIDSTKTDAVHEWLSQASQINSHAYQPSLSTVSDDDDSIFSASATAASGTHTSITRSTTDLERPHSSHIFREPFDVDSDDEFLVDAITQSIASGRASFNERNYQEASDALEEAFNMVLELPIRQQGICNTMELIYILAVCAFHLQDPASAKTALIGVIEAKVAAPDNDVRRKQVCEAGHLLAQTCTRLGELDQARVYCESAFQGRRRLLGKTHEDSFDSLALMTRVLELQGNAPRARALARMIPQQYANLTVRYQNLAIGPTKPTISSALQRCGPDAPCLTIERSLASGVAQVVASNEQPSSRIPQHLPPAEAEETYKRALAESEKALGLKHSSTSDTVNKLGNLYQAKGRFAEAEEMYKRALAGKEKALGPEHTSTLDTVSDLGNLYVNQGKPAEAEAMFERALAGREKALGPEQMSTLRIVNNLGNLYRAKGRFAEAEEMYKRALAGKEKALGLEHTSTLDTVNNLGNLCTEQGRVAEAEEMFKRALAGREKALGLEHTSTLNEVYNLGLLYTKQGRLAEAEEMYKRALAGYEKALGPEHTSTLDTVSDLGKLYVDQGKLAEAEEMYKRALGGKEKCFPLSNLRFHLKMDEVQGL